MNKTITLVFAAVVHGMAFAQGTYLNDPNDNSNRALIVAPGGNIGIGTDEPGSYILNVQQDRGVSEGFHAPARINNITFGYEANGGQRTAGLIAAAEGLPLTLGSFGVAGGF